MPAFPNKDRSRGGNGPPGNYFWAWCKSLRMSALFR